MSKHTIVVTSSRADVPAHFIFFRNKIIINLGASV